VNEVLKETVQKKYALGAFDIPDRITCEAVLAAAEDRHVPVILMVLESMLCGRDSKRFMEYLVGRCQSSSVPVALHLDHGTSFSAVMKAIHMGCTSVMLDASLLPFDENVKLTNKVIEAARSCNVSVEAEIGHVLGHEGNMLDGNSAYPRGFTTVEMAAQFYEETKVDCLAIAIGTVHGVFHGEPRIDYQRLKQIRETLPIPIVLHGGFGMSREHYIKCVENGINKINYYTGMLLSAGQAVKRIAAEKEKLLLTDVTECIFSSVYETVSEAISFFGTQSL